MNLQQVETLYNFQKLGYLITDHNPDFDVPEILYFDKVNWHKEGGNWSDSFDSEDPAYPAIYYPSLQEDKEHLVYVLVDEGVYYPVTNLKPDYIKIWKQEEMNW